MSDEQKTCFHNSLASIFIQLRRLEFGFIGCLQDTPLGRDVSGKTMSIDINVQEIEGINPSEIQSAYWKGGR